jgi:tetratricopeptide (TPR) repeat protein
MTDKLFIVFFSLIINILHAQGYYDMSALARSSYDKTLALRFDDAHVVNAQMRQQEPQNLMVNYIENLEDCLRVFISEERWAYDNLTPKVEKRLRLLRGGKSDSPYHLFTQAQSKLFMAMNAAKFGDYLAAINAASDAFAKLEVNQKKFPSFMPNKMSLGVCHAVVGTVPDKYKWGVKMISGIHGTTQQGQAEIEEVITFARHNDYPFEQEALVVYGFLVLHIGNDNDRAWQIVSSSKLKPKENSLAAFVLANVAARTGRNDKAIEILQNRPVSKDYFPFLYLEYMLGCAKMYRGDADAEVHIRRFGENFKGRNYLKEAYQRLAWLDLLRGSWKDYQVNISVCKTAGRADVGGDKNALKEAKSGVAPNNDLLRARLYFDGGYYAKAYQFLSTKEENFQKEADKLEFYYRMGRILQLQKRTQEAISYFDQTVQKGMNSPTYYPCNAALQLGILYTELGQKAKAKQSFNVCLSLNPDDHADALHAKAKAGLQKL